VIFQEKKKGDRQQEERRKEEGIFILIYKCVQLKTIAVKVFQKKE
jgi:hypothetical protein